MKKILSLGTTALVTFSVSLSSAMAQKAGEVNVYTARHYDVDKEINDKFTAKTGIKVNLVQIKEASQLIERVKSEGKNSPVDIIVTADVGNLWRAQDAKVLQPIKSKELESAVPANLRDPEGYWFGLAERARILVYNKSKVKESELSTYEDLASPKWKGKILVRTSNHVYNQSLVASFIAHDGEAKTEAWVKGITTNLARKPEGGDTDQIKAIAQGVGDIAIVNSYYVARLMKSQDEADKKVMEKIGVFFPNQKDRGSHVNISGAGVAAHSPNKDGAVKYIEFLASPEAQTLFANGNNEYPVRSGVEPDAVVKGFGKVKFDVTNLSKIGKFTPAAIKMMDKSGWR